MNQGIVFPNVLTAHLKSEGKKERIENEGRKSGGKEERRKWNSYLLSK